MGRKIFLITALVVIVFLIGVNLYLGKGKNVSLTGPENTPGVYPETKSIISPVVASEPIYKDSPDGKLTLLAKTEKDKEGVTYFISVGGKEIFVKKVDPSITISIPYNTWSPDGKYVFLKEEEGGAARFFVLSVGLTSSQQSDQTANITDLFAEKYPDLKIAGVTGWGGIGLVIVNSTKSSGEKGPSFWFEAPSATFIRLSTHF